MSETKWTPAQRAAIDDRGGALLVSAAPCSIQESVAVSAKSKLMSYPVLKMDYLS